jgi:tripartite ATP-independent transporter DctM subunit
MTFLVLICAIFFLVFTGMGVAFAIGVASMGYILIDQLQGGRTPLVLFAQQMLDGVSSFSVLAIPLFLFAGMLMTASGITERLVAFASALVGHLRGGLAQVGVVSNLMLAGMSGSAIADAAATSAVLVPEMKKKGYPAEFAAAVMASASMMGPIIPPSIAFILLGAVMNLSIGRLFVAGIVPGLLMFGAMFTVTYLISRRRGFPVEPRVAKAELWSATWRALLPLAAPLIVVRTMVIGVATPTEAAAILVAYVMVLGLFVFRSLTLASVFAAACKAAAMTGAIMLVVMIAKMFGYLAAQEGFGAMLGGLLAHLNEHLWILVIAINLLLLLLGTFIDMLPVMLIMAPIIFPLLIELGMDPIHIAVMMVINLTLGLLTPPVGLVLVVVSAASGVEILRIFRELLPYLVALIAVLMVVAFVPAASMWLPNLVFGK